MDQQQLAYFNALYDETYEDVMKYVVLHCRQATDVEDIMQNIYANFCRRLQRHGKLHFSDPLRYLLRIARDELTAYYRGKATAQRLVSIDEAEDEATQFAGAAFLTEEAALDQCQIDEIWNMIRCKDTLTFQICYLYFVKDLKLRTIADELNVPEFTVKNRLYRTIHGIQSQLKKAEEESPV